MGIIDLLFPIKCLECGKEGKYICSGCLKKVRKNGWNSDWVYSIWRNEGVIRKAILALKHRYSTKVAEELVEISVRRLKREGIDLENMTLVPIPLHWYKENLRGFNQSELIGKEVARKMGWKFTPNLLIQGSKKSVFRLNSGYLNNIPSQVILFDDVLKTGTTLLTASRVLRSLGVERLLCLTIAK